MCTFLMLRVCLRACLSRTSAPTMPLWSGQPVESCDWMLAGASIKQIFPQSALKRRQAELCTGFGEAKRKESETGSKTRTVHTDALSLLHT